MTADEARDIGVGDRVRDVTCGREAVVTRTADDGFLRLTFDRMKPDGGEWLGVDHARVSVEECDFLERVAA